MEGYMKKKIVKDLAYGFIEIDENIIKVIDHRSFQRLKNISQLTAHHLFPSANHTRFEHSLGVMYLSMRFLNVLESKIIEFGQSSNITVTDLFSEPKTMLEQIDELLELQKTAIEQEHARAIMTQKMKYAKLQNQINPHFLYNTLENIRGQAIIDDNYIIAEMTEALARYFCMLP
jgi:hypothetical protein